MVDLTSVEGRLAPQDAHFMARALFHAERGRASTTPNPLVGAVLVDNEGVVVGVGHHQRAGGPHAEVVALQAAGPQAAGSTLYCTLEPCSHTGRTGPCCVAVADAGIRRVVVATGDPFPQVAGRGLTYLRARGIEVTVGVGRREARRQNASFFAVVERGRPWVHLKIATSADGAVAAAPGMRTSISGPEAARWTQRRRGAVDAIAIGAGTALADDPLLTTRDVYRHRPLVRVVFDRRLRLPVSSRLARTAAEAPVWVLTAPERLAIVEAGLLRALGVEVIGVADGAVGASMKVLAERGVHSVLVEGGPTLHRACWDAGIVDRISQIVADVALGPDAVRWNMPAWSTGRAIRTVPLGRDVLLEADVHGTD